VPLPHGAAGTIVDLGLGDIRTGTPFRQGRLACVPAAFICVVIGELHHWRFGGERDAALRLT
jgi:hypothetical protein